jgi:hypothetical protein
MKPPGRPKKREDGICLKCGARPKREGQSWCGECFREFQNGHNQAKLSQSEAIGFGKGVAAAVNCLADEFERYDRDTGGRAMLEIEAIVGVIRRAPRPRYQP